MRAISETASGTGLSASRAPADSTPRCWLAKQVTRQTVSLLRKSRTPGAHMRR